jgi:ribosomal protein S18 acetylase RimI-like enzyme
MPSRDSQPALRFVLRRGLTGSEHDAALDLIARSNAAEGIELPVVLDASFADQILCLDGDELVGIASLQDGSEIEVSGAVEPEHRRRGFGRALLAAVRAECDRRGAPLLIVIDEGSLSGHGFVRSLGGRLQHSEHRMELDPTAIDRSRMAPLGLHIRAASAADRATLEYLQATAFGDTPEEAREYIGAGLSNPVRQYMIAEFDGSPVGLLRIGRYNDSADITAFGVLEALRGRGIGRAMLMHAIDILLAEGWARVLIEVFTDNENALGLYESCGFRVSRTYGYYEL